MGFSGLINIEEGQELSPENHGDRIIEIDYLQKGRTINDKARIHTSIVVIAKIHEL